MAVNMDKPDRWKEDIARSVDMFNDWFMRFAPEAYRSTRTQTAKDVEETLDATKNLTNVGVELLRSKPSVLPSLRMSTCPPLAVDRLIGLAGVSTNLVKSMDKDNRLPPRMPIRKRKEEATKMNLLRRTYGDNVRYILFLCGYFDSGYLGFEAAEGIDWVWEHRINDLGELGL